LLLLYKKCAQPRLARRSVNLGGVGIVSPYRSQIAALKESEFLEREREFGGLEISTVGE